MTTFTKEQLAEMAGKGNPFSPNGYRATISDLAAFALAQMEGKEAAEANTAWLIEMRNYVHLVPAWWGGTRYGWRHDANEAVRFCRQEDAERVIESMPWKHNAIATQHSWIPPMPKAVEGE